MTVAQLQKSLALWQRRKKFRYGKWRKYVTAHRKAHAKDPNSEETKRLWDLRVHWSELYHEAEGLVTRRQKQLKSVAATKMSSKGLDMLVREEGFVPYAYNDPAGHATFGVGHLIHLGRVTTADQRKWGTKAGPKSRAFVMEVLSDDIGKYEKAVRSAIGSTKLKQHEFDACVSLCFNIGTGGFAGSTVAKELRKGRAHLRAAADAFLLWDNPSMLRPRRERERKLFLTGSY